MYLPISKQKPCVYIYSNWEDRAYRLHHSNMLDTIAIMFVCQLSAQFLFITPRCDHMVICIVFDVCWMQEDGVAKVKELDKMLNPKAESFMKHVLREFCKDAR